mgnify:FL=1
MKVLVTGASGLLGHKLVEELLGKGHEVWGLYYSSEIKVEHEKLKKIKLDLRNRIGLEDLILKLRPDVVVHSAAYTNVDGCERDRKYAWEVNVEATRVIARAAYVTKAYLVYVSTDYVFDGEKGMYSEGDVPAPINYYGLTKLIGEEIVKTSNVMYCIVRTSTIWGSPPGKKNFAVFVVDTLHAGGIVKAIVDQYVSPTNNRLLAKAIAEVAERKPLGVLHVAGVRMSRYEFAVKVAEAFGLPTENIVEASMSDMKWVARRPRDSSLDTSYAKRILDTPFDDMELALRIFREEYG